MERKGVPSVAVKRPIEKKQRKNGEEMRKC